jgi:hypothetical protein
VSAASPSPRPPDLSSLFEPDAVRCAAWLARKFRWQFRLSGGVDCVFHRGSRLPRWFVLAMGVFKKRRQWDVRQISHPDRVVYAVRWLGARRWHAEGRVTFS